MDGIQLLSQLDACNNRGAKAAAAEQPPWQVAPQPDGRDWSQRTTSLFTGSTTCRLLARGWGTTRSRATTWHAGSTYSRGQGPGAGGGLANDRDMHLHVIHIHVGSSHEPAEEQPLKLKLEQQQQLRL